MQIKELFNFEDIQQVVSIGSIENEQEMVEKFVISLNLREDLLNFLEYLKGNKPEKNISINVIGNYGTGKSHLLSFLSIILSNPQMVPYIQDEEVKNAFDDLNREFLVVKYELPGQDKSLSEIFFYRVKKQLKELYGIVLDDWSEDSDMDPKELIREILLKIKEKYPNKGLIVIFDEYSDFLKSKESYKQNKDLQFTRQIAECSKDQDFILMLSMQEYIFSNPAYKDKADLINKIEKRFLKFNITSENVEDIIAKRMVSKTPNQIQEIKNQFGFLKEKFPNIALEEERYVKLFPVHPYLIEMLSKLTLFENRSILTFISNKTKKIQEEKFPAFITYDLIYNDLIESEHTVKNNEDVKPVVNIVTSLRDIVPRLDSRYHDRALRLIDALAIKNLVTPPDSKGEKRGGDTPNKFAENLFILPDNDFMDPVDDIGMILNMLISQSEGQFISRDEKSNTYFINLNRTTDYEQIINNKAENMDDLTHNNEVFVEEFLLNELGFEVTNEIVYAEPNKKYVIDDTVKWNKKNSFRDGVLVINIGHEVSIDDEHDFKVTIKGLGSYDVDNSGSNHILIKPKYSDKLMWSVRRLAAVNEFLNVRSHIDAMRSKKNVILDEELKKEFKGAFINSTIEFNSKEYTLEDLEISTTINSEVFSEIKEKLLDDVLSSKYYEYPKFKANFSKNNIVGSIETVINDIKNKERLENFDLKSTRILTPLHIYKDNIIDVNNSRYTEKILNELDINKNIAIEGIINEFAKPPFGFQREITYLLIAILLRNGNLIIRNNHGQSFSSYDFNRLFKNGLSVFDTLRYIIKEEGPSEYTKKLFDIFGLDRTLLQSKKDYNVAVKRYQERYDKIKTDISYIIREFEIIKGEHESYLPLADIEEKIERIKFINFDALKVDVITSFNKFDYSDENLNRIKESYELISKIKSFFIDYNNFIRVGMKYMENALDWINNDFFKGTYNQELKCIYEDVITIISDSRKLLKEDERRPIKGKIDLFKSKYSSFYYNVHEMYVGKNVDWNYLLNLSKSEEYRQLNILKNIVFINSNKFREIQFEIQNLLGLKCDKLNIADLKSTYHCSCTFPNNMDNNLSVNNEIDKLYDKSINLLNSWKNEIINNIYENKSKINHLEPNHHKIIEDCLKNNRLPDIIDFDLVNAVNNLLDDIEIREISINNLFDNLTKNGDTLKVEYILNFIEKYLKEDISNIDKTRIRLIK